MCEGGGRREGGEGGERGGGNELPLMLNVRLTVSTIYTLNQNVQANY